MTNDLYGSFSSMMCWNSFCKGIIFYNYVYMRYCNLAKTTKTFIIRDESKQRLVVELLDLSPTSQKLIAPAWKKREDMEGSWFPGGCMEFPKRTYMLSIQIAVCSAEGYLWKFIYDSNWNIILMMQIFVHCQFAQEMVRRKVIYFRNDTYCSNM